MYGKEEFKDKAMPAKDVEDFLKKYYKHDRYTGRGKEYAALLLKNYQDEFDEYGFTYISKWDSDTGDIVSFYATQSPA